eukprot:819506-Pyramimonas_sp.AAC.2
MRPGMVISASSAARPRRVSSGAQHTPGRDARAASETGKQATQSPTLPGLDLQQIITLTEEASKTELPNHRIMKYPIRAAATRGEAEEARIVEGCSATDEKLPDPAVRDVRPASRSNASQTKQILVDNIERGVTV